MAAAVLDTLRYKYNELCRLCATKTTVLLGVHIFENDDTIGQQIRKKIESCLPIQVHESDELPKMVCDNCLYKLNLLADFRERTVRTERLLLDLIKEINQNRHSQPVLNVTTIDHDLIMHQHQLLNNQVIDSVGEIDLSQLSGREQMIILSNQNVDINEYELTNQDISNHSLQTQDSILVETGSNNHDIDNGRFGVNLDLIQHHQQLINDQFRLQHELHITMTEASDVSEIHLSDGLNATVHHKIVDDLHQNSTFDNEPKEGTIQVNSKKTIKSSPKHEDGNSNNSLHIDDTKSIYMLQSDENNTRTSSSSVQTINNPDWVYCNICGKSCTNELTFEKHYETHFVKCNICFAVFTNSDVLNVHRKEAHGGSITEQEMKQTEIKTRLKRATVPIKGENSGDSNNSDNDDSADDYIENNEEEDEEVDEDENAVEEVVGKVSKRKIWSPKVCKECGKSYKTNYKLAEHMRKHTGEKPFKCRDCDKEFRSKIGLAQHEAKHTGKYDFACPTCGKGFQCKSYLMVHQRVHSDVKPYPCTTCGRNFKTKQSLLDHTNRHLGVKPYMCETCGRGFITKGLCKAHQKVHNGLDNRKYSCVVCKKKFVSKSYLQTHLRIHTGEKPFVCEVCGKGFLTKVDLRIHTTMHTGEKSYVCEMCGKAFARRDALRCHRRSHTGERPYSCEICGQTFTQFTPMAIHKRLHTGERPYACENCGKTFVSRSTMMAHAKKHTR